MKVAENIENFFYNDFANFGKNLEILISDYKRKSKRLDKIIKQSDKQQKALLHLNEELDEYKNHLEEKVEEEIKKREEKEQMLLQQSKLAAMGEMIDAIAHQWKQPINIIKLHADMLGYDFEDGVVDKEHITEFQQSIFSQVQHMMDTLNEFRSFFRPNKASKEFDIQTTVNKVLLLVKDELLKNKINITVNAEKNFQILGIENEFKHLILNILNNAKDAFNENDIKYRQIQINISADEKSNKIEFIDNAGGIPTHVIDDIFKANVTTKAEGKGTGIGLYMSSQIAAKHNGVLRVENIDNGAKFIFEAIN